MERDKNNAIADARMTKAIVLTCMMLAMPDQETFANRLRAINERIRPEVQGIQQTP